MSEPDIAYEDEPDRSGSGEEQTDGSSDVPADGPIVVELPTGSGGARLSLPPDATEDEVAALVAAVSSRLTEPTAEDDRDDEEQNAWRLAARLGVRRRVELPRECRRGGEWSAAARRP